MAIVTGSYKKLARVSALPPLFHWFESKVDYQTGLYSVATNYGLEDNWSIAGSVPYDTTGGIPSYNFSGSNSNEFVKTNAMNSDINDPKVNGYTVLAWLKIDNNADINTIYSTAGPGLSSSGYKLCINNWNTSNGRLNIEYGNGSQGDTVSSSNSVPLGDGVWRHVVWQHAWRDNQISFWIDGVMETKNATLLPFSPALDNAYVGTMGSSLSYDFEGKLASLRYYAGVLTDKQVKDLFNMDKAYYGR